MKCQNAQHDCVDTYRYTVLPWNLELIGDRSVFENLRNNIENEIAYTQVPAIENNYETDWVDDSVYSVKFAINRQNVIKDKVIELIKHGTLSIGGDVLLVEKSWAAALSFTKMQNNKLNQHTS